MGSRRAVVFLSALALGVAGCGDDEDKTESKEAVDDQAAIAQDSEAKSAARSLVTYVEACFADNMDYSACKEPDSSGGDEVGNATVASATPTTFVILSPSESGNEFRITRLENGALERECEETGKGGCPASSEW